MALRGLRIWLVSLLLTPSLAHAQPAGTSSPSQPMNPGAPLGTPSTAQAALALPGGDPHARPGPLDLSTGYVYRLERDLIAVINEDGTVTFHKAKLGERLRSRLGMMTHTKKPPPPTTEGGLDAQKEAQSLKLAAWPDEYGPPGLLISVGGSIPGLTDLLVSPETIKRRFLVRTAVFRQHLADEFRAKQARVALFELDRRLIRMWKDDRLSLKQRRARLFQHWDDCQESESAIATRARARIERFVRHFARAGTAAGYSRAELAALNATRRSSEPFAPYR